MADLKGKPLEILRAALLERRCRAKVHGETLSAHPPASVRGEQVIACDGELFRWGGEGGRVFGSVSDVGAAADAAVKVLKRIARWS
ncbi:hypothetical protein [Actinomadura sp. GTD37]|uniref:hypothetical protein n=1 Tax=Actinomadura sp. GTD37 TaxID=1778030 RepID=UPI0035C0F0F3